MYDIVLILSQVRHWEGNAGSFEHNAFSEGPPCNYAQFTEHYYCTLVDVLGSLRRIQISVNFPVIYNRKLNNRNLVKVKKKFTKVFQMSAISQNL